MESEEALRYYLDEVKDTQQDIHTDEEDHIPNESELAADFLQKAGLSDLSQLYQQGKEIPEQVVNNSVRQRNLTEKQAQTIRFRVQTLNKTLKSRQPRRKQRQDVRDVAWNAESLSIGSRSRSATPDSLDSAELLNDNGEHHLSSLPPILLSDIAPIHKPRVKQTSSEPFEGTKFNIKTERADVAHLGSENVILKGYQVLRENSISPRPLQRERSGSDPTIDIHMPSLRSQNNATDLKPRPVISHSQLSQSDNITVTNNCTKVYINCSVPSEGKEVSFEGLMKLNEDSYIKEKCDILGNGVSIDELTDCEYQHLKPLLYVELVAIFDQYKIQFIKRKASNKSKGGNVFGANLSTLVMRDMQTPNDNSMIPEIFRSILNELNGRCISEDGILRVAGQKQKLELLCTEIETKFFNNRQYVEDLLRQATVHELTGVLKKLLRELPDPLFTMELFDMFYKTSEIPTTEDKIKALNLLVLMLPIEHRNTFRVLLQFFLNIIKHQGENRMTIQNVAMITAPSFFPPKLLLPKDNKKLVKQLTKEELSKQINGAAVCCCIMEAMLRAGDMLWNVPIQLANQAREAQKRAQMRKDLCRDSNRKIKSGKIKLVRSSTQYEPGAISNPRVKRDFFV